MKGGNQKTITTMMEEKMEVVMYWFAFFYLIFVYPTTYRSYL